jgi:hypothetical protein
MTSEFMKELETLKKVKSEYYSELQTVISFKTAATNCTKKINLNTNVQDEMLAKLDEAFPVDVVDLKKNKMSLMKNLIGVIQQPEELLLQAMNASDPGSFGNMLLGAALTLGGGIVVIFALCKLAASKSICTKLTQGIKEQLGNAVGETVDSTPNKTVEKILNQTWDLLDEIYNVPKKFGDEQDKSYQSSYTQLISISSTDQGKESFLASKNQFDPVKLNNFFRQFQIYLNNKSEEITELQGQRQMLISNIIKYKNKKIDLKKEAKIDIPTTKSDIQKLISNLPVFEDVTPPTGNLAELLQTTVNTVPVKDICDRYLKQQRQSLQYLYQSNRETLQQLNTELNANITFGKLNEPQMAEEFTKYLKNLILTMRFLKRQEVKIILPPNINVPEQLTLLPKENFVNMEYFKNAFQNIQVVNQTSQASEAFTLLGVSKTTNIDLLNIVKHALFFDENKLKNSLGNNANLINMPIKQAKTLWVNLRANVKGLFFLGTSDKFAKIKKQFESWSITPPQHLDFDGLFRRILTNKTTNTDTHNQQVKKIVERISNYQELETNLNKQNQVNQNLQKQINNLTKNLDRYTALVNYLSAQDKKDSAKDEYINLLPSKQKKTHEKMLNQWISNKMDVDE